MSKVNEVNAFESENYVGLPFDFTGGCVANYHIANDIFYFRIAVRMDKNQDKIIDGKALENRYAVYNMKAYGFHVIDCLLVEVMCWYNPMINEFRYKDGIYYLNFDSSYVEKAFIEFKAERVEWEFLYTMDIDFTEDTVIDLGIMDLYDQKFYRYEDDGDDDEE